jgi:hypothetical protein
MNAPYLFKQSLTWMNTLWQNISLRKDTNTDRIVCQVNLPLDIFNYLLAMKILRLRTIITLTAVSKKLREIALSEKNWYIILDTKKILYDFVRRILQFKSSAPYPVNKIQKMKSTDYCDIYKLPYWIHSAPLDIFLNNRRESDNFYSSFTDYQYLYLGNQQGEYFFKKRAKIFTGVCILHPNDITDSYADFILDNLTDWNKNITEFIAVDTYDFDIEFCVLCHPQIEKINVGHIKRIQYLNQTQLKYLCITGPTKLDTICSELPDTIETLILPQCQYAPISLDQLNKFPHLNYLGINVPFAEFSTTLCINTMHLSVTTHSLMRLHNFCLPNIKNIIINFRQAFLFYDSGLHLTASNATTCHILNIKKNNLVIASPNCADLIIQHYEPDFNYNPNVFIPKHLGVVEWLLND